MRYLVNILCCSFFLFGELASAEEWQKMTDLPTPPRRLFGGEKKCLEKYFVEHMRDINPVPGLNLDSYLDICYRLATGNVLKHISDRYDLMEKVKLSQRSCRIPDKHYESTKTYPIKLNELAYNKIKVPRLYLSFCHCKFEGSHNYNEKFYVGVVIKDPSSRPQFYFQLDSYSQFHERENTTLQLSECWVFEE